MPGPGGAWGKGVMCVDLVEVFAREIVRGGAYGFDRAKEAGGQGCR